MKWTSELPNGPGYYWVEVIAESLDISPRFFIIEILYDEFVSSVDIMDIPYWDMGCDYSSSIRNLFSYIKNDVEYKNDVRFCKIEMPT